MRVDAAADFLHGVSEIEYVETFELGHAPFGLHFVGSCPREGVLGFGGGRLLNVFEASARKRILAGIDSMKGLHFLGFLGDRSGFEDVVIFVEVPDSHMFLLGFGSWKLLAFNPFARRASGTAG
jgi:hypothetical protein